MLLSRVPPLVHVLNVKLENNVSLALLIPQLALLFPLKTRFYAFYSDLS